MSEINFEMSSECQTRAEELAPRIAEPAQEFFTRARSVISRVVGGETLIVPVRAEVGNLSSIHSFKRTGSLIWQLLGEPRALPELVDAVEREFGIGQEQAQRDVTQFLADMLSVGLVQTCQRVAAAAFEMSATESPGMLEAAGSR
jgi:hypothetical protein